MKINKFYKHISILLFLFLLIFILGCCSPKYNYMLCRKRGEEALLDKKYIKARNYYTLIYTNEKKNSTIDITRTTWAYYRLGVIAEVSGNLKLAKGYYWGDSISEGFYDENPEISRLAKTGWKLIDENNKARTLEEILEFENTKPEEDKKEEVIERKKEVIIPKNIKFFAPRFIDRSGETTKTYSDSRTPPPYDDPEPYQVYY